MCRRRSRPPGSSPPRTAWHASAPAATGPLPARPGLLGACDAVARLRSRGACRRGPRTRPGSGWRTARSQIDPFSRSGRRSPRRPGGSASLSSEAIQHKCGELPKTMSNAATCLSALHMPGLELRPFEPERMQANESDRKRMRLPKHRGLLAQIHNALTQARVSRTLMCSYRLQGEEHTARHSPPRFELLTRGTSGMKQSRLMMSRTS